MFVSLRGRLSDLYFGWRMIAVGSVMRILGGGLYFYGFSVFFLPLSQDLGLSRAATSLVFSLARAQGAFEGPVAGYAMDRYGPRPLMVMALILTSIGHMLLAGVHSYFALVVVYMGLVSLSFHAGFIDLPQKMLEQHRKQGDESVLGRILKISGRIRDEVDRFVILGIGGGLAATPMARLRDRTREVLMATGLSVIDAERALEAAWHAPDPVASARPVTDLGALFDRLRDGGCRIAVATTDDRDPTERTLAALGVEERIDATVCADDGITVKPAPDMVLYLCATLGVEPARTAVVGDTAADLQMGRAAGAGLIVAVLTGVGGRADLAPLADVVIASVEELEVQAAR
jgi:phosphoglycolate phosphatase-like HAD superfamily hydrolase